MIIKRYTGTAFEEIHPKTKSSLIYNATNTETIFDSNDKLKIKYLPDSVFDSLKFSNTLAATNSYVITSGYIAGGQAVLSTNITYTIKYGATTLKTGNIKGTDGNIALTAGELTTFNTAMGTAGGTFTVIDATQASGSFIELGLTYSTNGTGSTTHSGIATYEAGQAAVNGSVVVGMTVSQGFSDVLSAAVADAVSLARSPIGYYFVINAAGTLQPITAQVNSAGDKYSTATFKNSDGGSTTNPSDSGALEAGDWLVITAFSGLGTLVSPYIFELAVVNNVYENATTTVYGTVRLSSQTAYASLSGTNVVTDGVLKTVIDNASFAASSHTHGNISSAGALTDTAAAHTSGDYLVLGATSGNAIKKSQIALGATTTTFLSNAGTWLTPAGTYSHPAYTTRSVDTSGVDVLDTFTSDATGHVTAITTRTLPNATTSAAGVMSTADKTKLDGIATGANNYVHPNHTGDVTSVGDGATTIATKAVTLTKMADLAANSIIGNNTASAATPIALTATQVRTLLNVADGANNYVHPNHTGDVTSTGDGATSIASNIVTNAKLATVATATIKGRATAGTGNVEDLTAAQVRTILNVADGANNYIHPTYTYTTPTADTQTTLSSIQLISTLAQTNGHVTGGTARKLVAGSNVTITPAADGNITIASSYTNTTYTAGEGLTLAGTTFRETYPLFVQTATPTTAITNAIWYDIN